MEQALLQMLAQMQGSHQQLAGELIASRADMAKMMEANDRKMESREAMGRFRSLQELRWLYRKSVRVGRVERAFTRDGEIKLDNGI